MKPNKAQKKEQLTLEKISKENLDLNNTLKKRTKELAQKNRELQIEAALEKVRARTMAMQRSNELAETASLLFQQVSTLGMELWGCAFNIWEPGDTHFTSWWGGRDLVLKDSWCIPLTEHPLFMLFDASRKRGDKLWVEEAGDEILANRYQYMLGLPDVGAHLQGLLKAGFTFPTFQIDHIVNFSHGNVLFITYEPCPKAYDIFKRFAKVFEQTYTRFLDLQKAEAQAREAQIQLALERVRARTMSMQHSNELVGTSELLFQQVKELGIDVWSCGYILWYDDDSYCIGYNPMPDGKMGPPFRIPLTEDIFFKTIRKAKRNGEEFFVLESKGKSLAKTYEYMDSLPIVGDVLRGIVAAGFDLPTYQVTHCGFFPQGHLMFITQKQYPEAHDIFKRFTKEFEQTYTRFLDLQKAEAQAREARIEAALEKVRARAMAMHKSEELAEAAELLYLQLKDLGINSWSCGYVFIEEEKEQAKVWMTEPDGKFFWGLWNVPLSEEKVLRERHESWKRKEKIHRRHLKGQDNIDHHLYIVEHSPITPVASKEFFSMLPVDLTFTSLHFSHGYLIVISESSLTEEAEHVLLRFAQVFELTYTRFLDLQKAEAQAREAEVETSLERFRGRTMAMHKSDELLDVVDIFSKELIRLEIPHFISGFVLINEENQKQEVWSGVPHDENRLKYYLPLKGDPILRKRYESWQKGETVFRQLVKGKQLARHMNYVAEHFQNKDAVALAYAMPDPIVFYCANFKEGYLYIFSEQLLSEEEETTLARFTKAFQQTYTRFLDLKKAETQAREARIEGALEKIRSRTMAMQHSDELPEAANLLFLEVQALGIPAWSAGYCIWENEDKKLASCNMSSEGEIQKSFILPTIGEGYNFYEPLLNGETFYVEELGGDALVKHYEFMRTLPTVGGILDELMDAGLTLPVFQIFHVAYFSEGYLMFITYEKVPDAHDIFKRFTKVFEQTYTRFMDLKKAEAQAREAIKQASLDRVRGEIASMRSTEDLQRITPLVFNELTTLGVPFIRCGVFIMDQHTKIVEAYLSSPEGKSLGVLQLPFDANPITEQSVVHWKKRRVFKEHWNKEEFASWSSSLMEQGYIKDTSKYRGASQPTESLDLHFIPFDQGMLYVGSEGALSDFQIELVQALANAFAIAYARYEDFVYLEKAKESIEKTLTELKATQSQLVQSEKMASLGELTAGIAHEIQNPLNFVNNFSEVSSELVDEMNEELDKGDYEEAKAISVDIKQNLEKINHHGKRADRIVKGMLQHSRSSNAQKEPTDINKLADEYLRLAYHGLRAKDKTFNATLETDFDESIGLVDMIPQDMGRVVLNLITNAFYAVDEKKKSGLEHYEPTVSVSTTKKKNAITLKVGDNGMGIPEEVKEKVFQPFFTTKPTGQGTGLGLSLSYDIVKAHGGTLTVKTISGENTEFSIILPPTK